MKRIYIWGLVMMALAVSSCKLGKKYTRPELDLPENIDGVQGDTTSVSGIHWSELYQDTVLQNLIRQTLEYNKNLQAAAARVKEMMEGKRISNADLYPKLDAKIYGEYEDGIVTIQIADDGIGMNEEDTALINSGDFSSSPEGSHVGIKNAVLRLKHFYGEKSSITVESEPDSGTIFTITIPYNLTEVSDDEFINGE